MKICGVVVLYNPDNNVFNNITSYLELIDELIIFDNSLTKYNKLDDLSKLKKIKYFHYSENKGIAFALKESLNYALDNNFDWCLTMDQDSYINLQKKDIEDVKNKLFSNNDYGILSFDYNNNSKKQIRNVKSWITSGNFINLHAYKEIDGFNEKLFIDFVDFDLCHQFYKINKKIGVMNYSITHCIGNPIKKKILGLEICAMNHSPIRYYYRYRNCVYLFKIDKKFYLKNFIYEFTVNFLKMIFFEKNRNEKIKMIKKGISDAKKGILGPINNGGD